MGTREPASHACCCRHQADRRSGYLDLLGNRHCSSPSSFRGIMLAVTLRRNYILLCMDTASALKVGCARERASEAQRQARHPHYLVPAPGGEGAEGTREGPGPTPGRPCLYN